MSSINGFLGEYAFLSNFYPAPIHWEGICYPTVEHAFQAAKTNNIAIRQRIARAKSAAEAKRLGGRRGIIKDFNQSAWNQRRLVVMVELLYLKFATPHLRDRLLATGDAQLVEANSWGDRYWGESPLGNGCNHLGKLLMHIRANLLEKQS